MRAEDQTLVVFHMKFVKIVGSLMNFNHKKSPQV